MGFWLNDPHCRDADKIVRAAGSYLMRMTSRATPFGLFAGSSVIELGARTELHRAPRNRYQRRTQLSIGYLAALAAGLATGSVAGDMTWFSNPSLYRLADLLCAAASQQPPSPTVLQAAAFLVRQHAHARSQDLDLSRRLASCFADLATYLANSNNVTDRGQTAAS